MPDLSDQENPTLSVWDYKPWWCQPWSILLTGIVAISGSWLLLKTIWITVLVAVPVLTWMGFFLLVYPQAMRDGILDPLLPEESTAPESR